MDPEYLTLCKKHLHVKYYHHWMSGIQLKTQIFFENSCKIKK